jgi:hypothetical protein
MWVYWVMFMLPAAAALFERAPARVDGRSNLSSDPGALGWALAYAALTILVGYRYRVGGDWANYLRYLELVRDVPLLDALAEPDPGYMLASWVSVKMGWDIYGLNLISAAIFSFGLIVFCRSLPRPWLALAVSMPYLVLVLGMGYSRQGVALGLGMLGLVALQKQQVARFVMWVMLGVTFHKTAVLLLPLAALAHSRSRYWTIFWVSVVAAAAYLLFLADSVDELLANYVDAEMESQGALVRLAMNAVPATILLLWPRRFGFNDAVGSLWRWFAIVSLVLMGILFVSPSSTVIDRIGLYMLPLQLVVFAYLPVVLAPSRRGNQAWLWVALVVIYYGAVLFVWLNFSENARYWIPYRFYPFEGNM